MLKNLKQCLGMILILFFLGTAFAVEKPAEQLVQSVSLLPGDFAALETGYLLNTKYSKELDTIGSATTNDTSWTFKNKSAWQTLRVFFVQNSVSTQFLINIKNVNEVRLRYLAADSTLFVEINEKTGWSRVPIIINSSSTNQDKYQIPLRTGSLFFAIRGENE